MASVAAASLGLPTELAESGDEEEEDESKASEWRFVAGVESAGQRGTGHVRLESGRFEIHTGKFGFHLALHGTPNGWAQKSSHGVGPCHLLQDGDEEEDLHLSESCERL